MPERRPKMHAELGVHLHAELRSSGACRAVALPTRVSNTHAEHTVLCRTWSNYAEHILSLGRTSLLGRAGPSGLFGVQSSSIRHLVCAVYLVSDPSVAWSRPVSSHTRQYLLLDSRVKYPDNIYHIERIHIRTENI